MAPRASAAGRRRLGAYDAKRDFSATPEPAGRGRPAARRTPDDGHGLYVVQKHDASRLHFDFRLEHDGALLSWAVPKGPSLDPRDRRLAVRVEDHPLEYADFEGTIPEGQYGAGRVDLWDRGRWQAHGDVARSLARGHLDFRLAGGRLAGEWHLVRLGEGARTTNGESRDWLLIRGGRRTRAPRTASTARPTRRPAGRGEVLSDVARQFELATAVERPPGGKGWVHERKWDGYRLLVAIEGGTARVWSRSGEDWSDRVPEILPDLARLPVRSAVVDGELIALSGRRSDFQSLQSALGEEATAAARARLRFVAFDLLAVDGEDLRPLPLVERKRRLARLLARRRAGSRLLPSPHRAGRGADRLAEACERGLEGIVSKRADAPYRPGRTGDWQKSKCRRREEFVIVGYTLSRSAARRELGALLLATRAPGRGGTLRYAGRVGTGFGRAVGADLLRRLGRIAASESAVAGPVPGSTGVQWVDPELVAEVRFVERTADGLLRQPSFVGLREDKPARDVRAERPRRVAPVAKSAGGADVAGVRITHPDRRLFPRAALTKLDLARYLEATWPRLEPHLRDRPLAFLRCPEGAREECFFQKHWPEPPPGTSPVDVSEAGEREAPHLVVTDPAGLVALAQNGIVEIHLWGSRRRRLERPDRLVFDLDPGPRVAWRDVVAGARALRDLLARLELESFPLLTGGKGVHVVAPLRADRGWDEVRSFAAAIARAFAAAAPDLYVDRAAKTVRGGRIFVDYLRNGRGATAIAPYSPRARSGAPVATPVGWEELARASPARWTLATLPARLRSRRADPWQRYFEVDQTITREALATAGLAGRPGARTTGRRTMAARKSGGGRRYGKKAAEKVERAMHEMKRGKLRSGGSGKKVTSRKQAIAIGLSQAREAGGKVPPAKKSAKRKK